MAKSVPIAAKRRERAGKGAARATRRAGRVPAVVYGNKQPPENVSLEPNELMAQLKGPGFFSRVFALDVEGTTTPVLARDLQVDPVTNRPIHVDFMRFGENTKLRVDVQVVFTNELKSPGLKRGGVLNVVRHEIEVICTPDRIPEMITVDLADLDIGDSVHISHVNLPEGVQPTITDRDFTIATIAAPSQLETAEETAAAAEAAAAAAAGAEGAPAAGAEGAAAPAAGAEGAAKGGAAPAKGGAAAAPADKGKGKK